MKKYLLIALLMTANSGFGAEFMTFGDENFSPNILCAPAKKRKVAHFPPSYLAGFKSNLNPAFYQEAPEKKMDELHKIADEIGEFRMLEQLESWIKDETCNQHEAVTLYGYIAHDAKFCTQIKYAACLDMMKHYPMESGKLGRNLSDILENPGDSVGHKILVAQQMIELFGTSQHQGVPFLERTYKTANYIDFIEIMDTFLKHGIYTRKNVIDAIISRGVSGEDLNEHAQILEYLLHHTKISNHPKKEDILTQIYETAHIMHDMESERLKGVNLTLNGGSLAYSTAKGILTSIEEYFMR